MSYLIIVLVIALALAPLSHFVPSKAQRKVARLREYAALNGLYVEFRDVPRAGRSVPARQAGNTIYYGKRVRGSRGGPEKRLAWLHSGDGWAALSRHDALPPELAALPDGVLAASADLDSCGIYWNENGEEAQIDQICQTLEGLTKRLYQ
ncbi:MAG: hypothetical protein V7709_17390 [Halioglobus sp.]